MGLKNWTIVAKAIKGMARGASAYRRYLVDTEHRNHKGKTESIDHVWGDAGALVMNQMGRWRQMEATRTTKRGRPRESLAHSFVLSLPRDALKGDPTAQDWNYIAQVMMHTIAEELGESLATIRADSFANVHMNQANPHLNLMIGALRDDDGQIVDRRLGKKGITHALKRVTTPLIDNLLDLDHATYKPRRAGLRAMEKWQWEQAKALDARRQEIDAHLETEIKRIYTQASVDAFHNITKKMDDGPGAALRKAHQKELIRSRQIKESIQERIKNAQKDRFTATKGLSDPKMKFKPRNNSKNSPEPT